MTARRVYIPRTTQEQRYRELTPEERVEYQHELWSAIVRVRAMKDDFYRAGKERRARRQAERERGVFA